MKNILQNISIMFSLSLIVSEELNPFLSHVLRPMFSMFKKSILCLEWKKKPQQSLVWLCESHSAPAFLLIQAASPVTESPVALTSLPKNEKNK